MKIEVAKNTGFCTGVRKGVMRIVGEIHKTNEDILVYGPLIHNPQTVSILDARGIKTIDELEDIDDRIVAIRTHGIPKESLQFIRSKAKRYINLTCGKVARVQAIVRKYSREGCFAIIIGDKDHAEVKSIMSYASAGVFVFSGIEEIDRIPKAGKYIVVAQTTLSERLFHEAEKILKKRFKECVIVNTICDATHRRQSDVLEAIKRGIDALIVVGGKNSGNTRRLAQIGYDNSVETFHIETEKELEAERFASVKYVLVTAGASTPGWIVNNVLERLHRIKKQNERRLYTFMKACLEFAARTNVFSSVVTFFIALFIQEGGALHGDWRIPAVAGFFIFSMYTVNNFFTMESLRISNPFKYALYQKSSFLLMGISILSCLAAIIIMFLRFDFRVSLVYIICVVLGVSYSMPVVLKFVDWLPAYWMRRTYQMKSMVASLGWIAIACFLPYYAAPYSLDRYIPLLIVLVSIILVRNILLDIIEYQNDLILGRVTAPTVFGIKKTRLIIIILTAFSILSLAAYAASSGSYITLLVGSNFIYYLFLFRKIVELQYYFTLKYELLVDLNLFFLMVIIVIIIMV